MLNRDMDYKPEKNQLLEEPLETSSSQKIIVGFVLLFVVIVGSAFIYKLTHASKSVAGANTFNTSSYQKNYSQAVAKLKAENHLSGIPLSSKPSSTFLGDKNLQDITNSLRSLDEEIGKVDQSLSLKGENISL